ncbi:MAG TPA: conjugal transfer protein TraR [Firmicutes bacterium]|jgi:YteA family regulatory protein|nr:conjugal transfer protein TraR [Bacillota bacterium]
MLSKKTIRRFEKKLRDEWVKLSKVLKHSQEMGLEQNLKESVSELSAYDNHPADLGSETFEREKDLGLANTIKVKQAAIEDALDRIKEGKYGVCLRCGRPIAEERLEALPQSLTCFDCQLHQEQEEPNQRYRPLEEEVLAYPFGRSFTGGDDENVEFDGEDAWQAVAQFGTSESPQDLGGNVSFDEMYSDEPRGIVSMVENEQVQEEGAESKQ